MADATRLSGPYVFLSYASADRDQALQIADRLEANGVAVWIDRKSIAGGTSWSAEIVRGIEGCAVLAVLSSPASMASPNVQQEIQLAWESRRPILPLVLEPAHPPEAIRYALAGRQWVEVLDRPDTEWLAQAQRALRGLGVEASPPDVTPRTLRTQLEEARFAAEWARGQEMPFDQAIAEVLAEESAKGAESDATE